MNGAVPSLYDPKARVLKLGESFEKQPRCAFHTVRCECWRWGGSRGLRGSGRGSAAPDPRGFLRGGGGCGRSRWLPLSRDSGAQLGAGCPGVLVRDFGSDAGFSRCGEHVRPLYPRAAPRYPLGTNFAFYTFSIASPCGLSGNRAKLNLWLCPLSLRSVFRSSVQFSNQRLKAGGVNHGASTPSLST